ncbi:MAG TPA: radical SAM protein [Candidatus Cloacimonadota bacterium]|nr:radical SAM protein [Candidatus Cloacimonadota bacterium]HOQ80235.1 radical SAM protein [Candidatus Cloacimonadota bacterium]
MIKKRNIQILKNIATRTPSFTMNNILLTYHCTQRCLQCNIPFMKSEIPFMTEDVFNTVIDRLDNSGAQGITLSGGEPMLHPQLDDFAKYAKSKQFKRVHLLSTLYGPEELVDKTIETVFRHKLSISCSFDGFGSTVDEIRQAENVSDTVQKNMQKIIDENKRISNPIKTSVNIVISQKNLAQIPDILDYIESIGWNFNIDIYRFTSKAHRENDDMKVTENEMLSKIIKRIIKSPYLKTPIWLYKGYEDYLNNNYKKICPYINSPVLGSKFFIQPNGDVKVCIGDPIGNLAKQTAKEIFSSQAWKERKQEIKECRGCWNTCYTPGASIWKYLDLDTIKQMTRIKPY